MNSAALQAPVDIRLMKLTTTLMLVGLVLAGLAAGLWWGLRHPMFAIRHISVSGDVVHSSAAGLRRSVMPQLDGNFFTLDLNATRAVFQSVPWVRNAVVRRRFPDRLEVVLKEHVAAAHWGDSDTQLVNTQGEVFEVSSDDAGDLDMPVLSGPDGQAGQLLTMFRQLDPLVRPLGAQMVELSLQARGNWRAELDQGAVLELGRGTPDELAQRLRQFVGTVSEVAARHQRTVSAIEAADLRHMNGYALRLRGVSTVQAEPTDKGLKKR